LIAGVSPLTVTAKEAISKTVTVVNCFITTPFVTSGWYQGSLFIPEGKAFSGYRYLAISPYLRYLSAVLPNFE
jgi:hypothetical protein